MLDQEHGLPLGLELQELLQHLGRLRLVHPCGGLVQNQDVGGADVGSGDLGASPVGVGECVGGLGAMFLQALAESVDFGLDGLALDDRLPPAGGTGHQRQPGLRQQGDPSQDGPPLQAAKGSAGFQASMESYGHILLNAHGRKDPAVLEGAGHPLLGHVRSGQAGHGASLKADLARVGLEKAADQVDGRGLA